MTKGYQRTEYLCQECLETFPYEEGYQLRIVPSNVCPGHTDNFDTTKATKWWWGDTKVNMEVIQPEEPFWDMGHRLLR